MGNFVIFLRLFDHRIHSKVDIELIFLENMKYSAVILEKYGINIFLAVSRLIMVDIGLN